MNSNDKNKGACIITSGNSKECVPETTKDECKSICADKPDAKCELSSELTCPRGQ
jgi:hypothetical protein